MILAQLDALKPFIRLNSAKLYRACPEAVSKLSGFNPPGKQRRGHCQCAAGTERAGYFLAGRALFGGITARIEKYSPIEEELRDPAPLP